MLIVTEIKPIAKRVVSHPRVRSHDTALHSVYLVLVTLGGNPQLTVCGVVLICYTVVGVVLDIVKGAPDGYQAHE